MGIFRGSEVDHLNGEETEYLDLDKDSPHIPKLSSLTTRFGDFSLPDYKKTTRSSSSETDPYLNSGSHLNQNFIICLSSLIDHEFLLKI